MTFNELYKLIEESSAKRSYSCLMLDLGDYTDHILELHDQICPCDIYDAELGHGLETEFHCTVKYGIHAEYTPLEVFNTIDLVPSTIKFKELSLFKNEKYDVLKFDIISKDLNELNKQVSENLDCTDSFPVYHAHATVAYLKPGTGKHYLDMECELLGKTITSDRYIFSNPNSEKVMWVV
jgi:hypothetical protein